MNRKDLYIIGAILALAIVGGMVLHAYISSKIAVVQAEQVKVDVQTQINSLRSDLKDSLAEIAKDKQLKAPAAIVQQLPQYIPLPKPIVIAGPSVSDSKVEGTLPTAPAPQGLLIPTESVNAFWQHETDCRADSLKLDECQKEVPLLTKRAEAAEKAMHGGGFWSRLKGNAKWMVIGAAGGAAAVAVARH